MAQQLFGHIVNTASLGGLLAMPGEAAYTTAKHGVVGLTKALREEAFLWNVRVSVLCPGLIRTELLDGGGEYGKDITGMSPEKKREFIQRYHPMDPAAFARKALDAVAKNKMIIVLPWWWRVSWWVERLSPSLMMWLLQKQVEGIKRELERQYAQGGGANTDNTGGQHGVLPDSPDKSAR
jgi:short-subunit dehydrogenase